MGFGYVGRLMDLESQMQFGDIPWARKGSAGTSLDRRSGREWLWKALCRSARTGRENDGQAVGPRRSA